MQLSQHINDPVHFPLESEKNSFPWQRWKLQRCCWGGKKGSCNSEWADPKGAHGVFLEITAMASGCGDAAFLLDWSQILLRLFLSRVLFVRLVNEPSSSAYVHSCPDVASGPEAPGWWLGPFTHSLKGTDKRGRMDFVLWPGMAPLFSIRARQEMEAGADTQPSQIPCPNNGQTQ